MQVTDAALPHFEKMPRLRRLFLQDTAVTPDEASEVGDRQGIWI